MELRQGVDVIEVEESVENRWEILKLLLPVLQATEKLKDLIVLDYDESTEMVHAIFKNGYTKQISVFYDSGTAMIKDILTALA